MAINTDHYNDISMDKRRFMEEMKRQQYYEMQQRAMRNIAPPEAQEQEAKKPSKPKHLNPKLLIVKGPK